MWFMSLHKDSVLCVGKWNVDIGKNRLGNEAMNEKDPKSDVDDKDQISGAAKI